MTDHECGIDCEVGVTPTGGVAHLMFPTEPNEVAGRYQARLNAGMTRREYRESGQDESRAVRVWNQKREARLDLIGPHAVPRRDAVVMLGGLPFVAHDIRMTRTVK